MGKVKRTVSVLITGTSKITPHAALDVLLDLPPFDIFYKKTLWRNSERILKYFGSKQYHLTN